MGRAAGDYPAVFWRLQRLSCSDRTTQVQYLISAHHDACVRINPRTRGQRRNAARKGTWMKTLLMAFALGTFAQGALAGESDCRAIESTGGRLACYDAAFPPKTKKPATVENDASRAAYMDPFITEDARTTAKLKNICRGC
jgi:hypothetical protein